MTWRDAAFLLALAVVLGVLGWFMYIGYSISVSGFGS